MFGSLKTYEEPIPKSDASKRTLNSRIYQLEKEHGSLSDAYNAIMSDRIPSSGKTRYTNYLDHAQHTPANPSNRMPMARHNGSRSNSHLPPLPSPLSVHTQPDMDTDEDYSDDGTKEHPSASHPWWSPRLIVTYGVAAIFFVMCGLLMALWWNPLVPGLVREPTKSHTESQALVNTSVPEPELSTILPVQANLKNWARIELGATILEPLTSKPASVTSPQDLWDYVIDQVLLWTGSGASALQFDATDLLDRKSPKYWPLEPNKPNTVAVSLGTYVLLDEIIIRSKRIGQFWVYADFTLREEYDAVSQYASNLPHPFAETTALIPQSFVLIATGETLGHRYHDPRAAGAEPDTIVAKISEDVQNLAHGVKIIMIYFEPTDSYASLFSVAVMGRQDHNI